ncbi:MAG: endopeptidase La [Tissierellales bacterium]|nr:endopeptidase La [Tissierellales bacterium]MBN2827443.1 endopeptidase La [Tissierellales bacterium]
MSVRYTINKRTLPMIPLRGMHIFPNMVIHFDVGRDKSVNALEEGMIQDSMIFLTSQKDANVDQPNEDDYYSFGVVCKVKQMLRMPGDNIRVLVEGLTRGRIISVVDHDEDYLKVEIEEYIYLEDEIEIDEKTNAMMRLLKDSFEEYCEINPKIPDDTIYSIREIEQPERLSDIIVAYIFLKPSQKQEMLETLNPYERLEKLQVFINQEIKVLELEETINQRVKKQINQFQKEYYLKEQMKAIQKELGEEYDANDEIEEYFEKIAKAKMPKEAKEKAEKEAERLSKINSSSPESGVIRSYLDWLIDLPWSKSTKDNKNIGRARQVLEEDHCGLEDVKERILEFLAVRQLNPRMKSPIICLVGPPGVGKTSIAKSIARALDRNFIRMSLGGVRDEAEIRGHRRTYIGSIPGRIISNIAKAKSNNPVFLFDEIDKLANDFRGDPSSALLEVLDPEQNNSFTDHYLETAFDLSKVMFITTANSTSTIPGPLLDRMEIIEISGYTDEEKVEIGTKYLLPKQLAEHKLTKEQVRISENTLVEIIQKYTRESGVRSLERKIGSIIRKSAVKIIEQDLKSVTVNKANLEKYLGIPRYRYDAANKTDQVGIATGLAWTAVGGETLFIEVNLMNGEGKIQLTGQLGDIMKESAQAGLSYIRAHLSDLKIDEEFYKKMDIHIHVPEGAIPKDGPSAGITMATAVVSALTGFPVRRIVAMTGEITLRGRVLPIGGVKEKVLAAKRAGITTVILPKENEKDADKLPQNIKKTMRFVFADTMDDVLKEALIVGETLDH